MLMRAEGGEGWVDCNDSLTKLACELDSEDCPAACKANNNETDDNWEVVKSGDLELSVNSNKGADAFLYGGVSDLDTISFKASEEGINLTKVTLERYGYSSSEDVEYVWLENEDGTRVTDPKELNSKDQVTLSILKDYRKLSENTALTIVLQTVDGKDADYKAGSSIGFKVIGIESSAADVEWVNEKGNPYLYDLVSYNGSDVIFTYKGKEDTYHIGEGPYEVFRFKLKAASTSAASVRGFTVTNVSGKKHLDLKDFVDGVEVTVNDEKVKNVTYSIDDDEITVSFDEVEVEAKATAIFAMNIELSDDFDEMESTVLFELEEASDLKVSEKKTGARVTIANFDELESEALYSFNGSKINLSNTKLGTVNMPAGSEDVAVAEWTIELGGQSIVIAANTIEVVATSDKIMQKKWNNVFGAWIEAMRLVVAGEEFDAKCENTADKETTCTFNKKMTIEKEGKLQLVVDVDDDATADSKVEFVVNGKSAALSKTTLWKKTEGGVDYVNGLTYEESKDNVLASDFIGNVQLYNLKVTAAKASLENELTKSQEFKQEKTTSDITVFEGTYTAKKQDLTLTDVNYTPATPLANEDDSITFNLYIDGKQVASTDIDSSDAADKAINDSISRVKVAAGESVKVEVKATVYAVSEGTYSYNVEIVGEDADGNEAGKGSDYTVDMKFVSAGTADVEAISNSNYKQKDVLLRTSNIPVAAFRVSSSNGTVDLDSIEFTLVSGVEREAADGYCTVDGTKDTTVAEADCESSDAVEAADGYCTVNGTKDTTVAEADCTGEWKVWTPAVAASPAVTRVWTPAVAASETTPLTEDDIRVKIDGENVDEEDIDCDANGVCTVSEIWEEDIDKNGIEVIVTLKGTPLPAPYVLTLNKVNDDKPGLEFKKNVVPALLTIEQTDNHGSTTFKFTVDKYENGNTVSNVCFFDEDDKSLGKCLNETVSNWSTLEISWTDGVTLIGKITYKVAGTNWGDVEISKDDYNDYFKVWSTYLKVFDKDSK